MQTVKELITKLQKYADRGYGDAEVCVDINEEEDTIFARVPIYGDCNGIIEIGKIVMIDK